jgi:hypothetical protein
MHVVWHYDIATNSNAMSLRFRAKHAKRFMHFWAREKSLPLVGIKCDEIERANAVKQTAESRRSPRPLSFAGSRHDEILLVRHRKSNFIETRQRLGRARRLTYFCAKIITVVAVGFPWVVFFVHLPAARDLLPRARQVVPAAAAVAADREQPPSALAGPALHPRLLRLPAA